MDWLRKIESTSEQAPEILLQVEGDPQHLESLKVKFRVEGKDLRFEDMEINALRIHAEMDHGTWRLHEFFIEDEVGSFHMAGVRRPGDPWLEFSARSSMNLLKLLGIMFGKQAWSEVQVTDSPRFQMDGKWWFDQPPWRPVTDESLQTIENDSGMEDFEKIPLELTGEFESGPFFTRGVSMNGIKAMFSLRGGDFYLRDLSLKHQTGRVNLDFMRREGDLRFQVDSTMDLTKLAPIIDLPMMDEVWSWFKIRPQSQFHLHAQGGGSEKNLEAWEVRGGVKLSQLEFKGLEVQTFESDILVDGRKVRLKNMKLNRPEGSGSVEEISFDRITHVLEVKNCQAKLTPGPVVRTFNPMLADEIEKWKFPGIPKVKVSGYVAPEWKNHLKVEIDTDGRFSYHLAGKDLPLTGVDGSITFIDKNLHLDFTGQLYGGKIAYRGKVSVYPQDQSHSGDVRVEDVDYGDLYQLYQGDDDEAEGDLTGRFQYWAKDFELNSLNGQGAGIIVNGNLYSLPFLGPLTSLVREVLPQGLRGYNTAKQADATWVVRDGVLYSQDMTVEADAYVMRLDGQIDMVKDAVGIDAEVEVRGVPGVLLLPVTSLMTYRGTGTMEKTNWELKIISSKEGLKEVPGKILTLPFRIIHKPFQWMRDFGRETEEMGKPAR